MDRWQKEIESWYDLKTEGLEKDYECFVKLCFGDDVDPIQLEMFLKENPGFVVLMRQVVDKVYRSTYLKKEKKGIVR